MVDGYATLLSPDGTRLAFRHVYHDSAGACTAPGVEIMDVSDERATLYVASVASLSGPSEPSVEGLLWAPDSSALVFSVRDLDVPWIHLWRDSDGSTKPASLHQPAGGNISPRTDPELDAIFGSLGWGLANPRFDGPSLVADIVCLAAAERCAQSHAYQARDGEDGVFDTVAEVS